MATTKKILLLYSKTGGGHKSVAEALRDGLLIKDPALQIDMKDPWVEEAPSPLNKLPAWYPYAARSKFLWQSIYELTDRKLSSKILKETYSQFARSTIKRLLSENYDLIVSTHFGYNEPILDNLERNYADTPYITVVTDFISAHILWFDPRAHACIVPSVEVQRLGESYNMPKEKLPICGLPLKHNFEKKISRAAAEKIAGLKPTHKLRLLLMGGGEGIGPILSLARQINQQLTEVELIIVAGNNTSLKRKLEDIDWQIDHAIVGFTEKIAELLKSSDIVLTKGGAITVFEAMTIGTPALIYDYLPGQEEGNVIALLTAGAGQYLPESTQIIAALQRFIDQPKLLANFRAGCATLSQAGATKRAVEIITNELTKLNQ